MKKNNPYKFNNNPALNLLVISLSLTKCLNKLNKVLNH